MKKTQTSATVNFNSSELDNFRIFRVLMEGMGRLHMQPCGFSQCFTTNQMIPLLSSPSHLQIKLISLQVFFTKHLFGRVLKSDTFLVGCITITVFV